jgi:hypothetical protein
MLVIGEKIYLLLVPIIDKKLENKGVSSVLLYKYQSFFIDNQSFDRQSDLSIDFRHFDQPG